MRLFKKIIKLFLDCIFPIECLGCGKEGIWICNDCLLNIQLKTDFPCVVCGKPTIFGKTHKECLDKTAINGAMCATSYEEALIRKMLHTYKYKYAKDIGRYLGWIMAKHIKQLQNNVLPRSVIAEGMNMKQLIMMRMMPDFLHKSTKQHKNVAEPVDADAPILIPVPLHARRLRERGFNQSEILAKEFGKYFGWEVRTDVLKRVRYTTAQMTLKSHDRVKNIKNAFEIENANPRMNANAANMRMCLRTKMQKTTSAAELNNDVQIPPEADQPLAEKNRTVILIDDVLTTGATTNEAAKSLKIAGAKEVWVMCLAKD